MNTLLLTNSKISSTMRNVITHKRTDCLFKNNLRPAKFSILTPDCAYLLRSVHTYLLHGVMNTVESDSVSSHAYLKLFTQLYFLTPRCHVYLGGGFCGSCTAHRGRILRCHSHCGVRLHDVLLIAKLFYINSLVN